MLSVTPEPELLWAALGDVCSVSHEPRAAVAFKHLILTNQCQAPVNSLPVMGARIRDSEALAAGSSEPSYSSTEEKKMRRLSRPRLLSFSIQPSLNWCENTDMKHTLFTSENMLNSHWSSRSLIGSPAQPRHPDHSISSSAHQVSLSLQYWCSHIYFTIESLHLNLYFRVCFWRISMPTVSDCGSQGRRSHHHTQGLLSPWQQCFSS